MSGAIVPSPAALFRVASAGGLALALALAVACGAQAQEAADEAPATDAAPRAQLETFEQWTLRCVERADAPPCDVVQILTDPASGSRVIAVSVARSPAEAINAIQIVGPLGVHIPSGLDLAAGATRIQGVRFTRCELSGCYVEAQLGDDLLAALRSADVLTLTYASAPDAPIAFELDLAGFADAYDALVARNDAAPPPAAE